MNHSSFTRIFRLDEILRNGAFQSISQGAEDLEVSKRTSERDLEKMRYELGADIEYNRHYSRYEYTGSTVALPAGWLNDSEIAVIVIAERARRMYAQASVGDSIHPAFNKMLNPVRHKSDMMESIREKCRSVYFHRSFEDVRGLRNEFSKILRAIMERKRISIDYPRKGGDDIIKRDVEPYSLVNNNSEWQVIARSVKQRRIKTFALKRISNIKILDYYFDIPDKYDVRDYVFHPFDDFKKETTDEIEINVYPPVSKSVKEVIWHSFQVMKNRKRRYDKHPLFQNTY